MLSIILPTLNEEAFLRRTILHTLERAESPERLELLVVDAGSTDGTVQSIEDLNVQVLQKPEFIFKKHESLTYGVSKSTHDIIMFLDADTLLPRHFDVLIEEKLKNDSAVGGAFEFAFEDPDWKLALLTLVNRIRYRWGKVFYGDQAVFVRRKALDQIGGVPKEPLMETAFLCKELRKVGQLSIIRPALKTSPRRFKTHGFFKVSWFDLNMFIRFNLGLPVSGYAKRYWSKNLTTR
ncbi:glycosyltransferase [Ekhidna sp.]|uniref:glycosyltransferase n=1 Tax=Ekhidna sp. TaxID=2608089 RepID=UPI0035116585